MPRYELSLILKAMQRPETVAVVRRTVGTLMEQGAVVRSLESHGERRLPYKIAKHNLCHTHGCYFMIDFHAAPSILPTLLSHLSRDVDVVRTTMLKKDTDMSKAQCCGPRPSKENEKPA